ncbi:MAG: acyl--CoA ligase [Actinobacteria bacterium]|nr:acyl--CoA ligase [Actinomycetota bacterium]
MILRTIGDLARRGDRPAVLGGVGAPLDHHSLAELVASLAAGLRRRGIGPGRVVAVALPSGPTQVAATLAVLAAGATAAPLLLDWWPRELEAAADLLAADLVIGDRSLPSPLRDRAALVDPAAPLPFAAFGCGHGEEAPLDERTAHQPLVGATAELWVPSTGGTGEPGVFAYTATQLERFWLRADPPLGGGRAAVWTPVAHGPTLRFVLGALAGGGSVICTDRWAPRRATADLADRRPDVLWAGIGQLGRVLGVDGDDVEVGTVIATGGPVTDAALRRIGARFGATVQRRYTAAEAGGWVSIDDDTVDGVVGAVLHDGERPAQITVEGPGTAVRARGRAPRTPQGWATGDRVAEADHPGRPRPSGRIGDTFAVDGAPVHPADVEAVLAEDPRLHQVAVVPRPDPVRGSIAVAVTVPTDPEDPPFLSDLAERLAAVAPHARPLAQAIVDELPLTVSGQVHRRLLVYEEASR